MSMVVEILECRICPWASFGSAPAIFSQTACEVRRHRQFTQVRFIAWAAGFMKRARMLLSRIGFPSFTDWNTRSLGPSLFTTRYFRMARPALTSTVRSFRRCLHDIFVEDFRKELAEIQNPAAKRLFILAKAIHLTQLRIAEYAALVAAADVTGHYGVGVLLESCLADKLAFVERTRRMIRNAVEAKVAKKMAERAA